MAPPLRVIGYCRVSTAEQAESGLGLEAQEQRIRQYADLKGWAVVEIIRDEGVSGATVRRKGLRRALRAIAAGDADGLVCAKLDRLSRSQRDLALLFDWFDQARATLALLDANVDTSSPIGGAILSFMGIMAQLERDLTSERTRSALAELRRQGRPTGRPAVADHPELQRRIQRLREAGRSLQQIADALNADGIPTLRGAPAWSKSSVRTATGYQRPGARRSRATLPALPARAR